LEEDCLASPKLLGWVPLGYLPLPIPKLHLLGEDLTASTVSILPLPLSPLSSLFPSETLGPMIAFDNTILFIFIVRLINGSLTSHYVPDLLALTYDKIFQPFLKETEELKTEEVMVHSCV
jgi:hypothetical protein